MINNLLSTGSGITLEAVQLNVQCNTYASYSISFTIYHLDKDNKFTNSYLSFESSWDRNNYKQITIYLPGFIHVYTRDGLSFPDLPTYSADSMTSSPPTFKDKYYLIRSDWSNSRYTNILCYFNLK